MNREKYKYTWTHSTVHITELSWFFSACFAGMVDLGIRFV